MFVRDFPGFNGAKSCLSTTNSSRHSSRFLVHGPAAGRVTTSSTKAMHACVRSCFRASSAFGRHAASLTRCPIYARAGLEPTSVMHQNSKICREWHILIVMLHCHRTCLVASASTKMCFFVCGPMPNHVLEHKCRTNIILLMVRPFLQDCPNLC